MKEILLLLVMFWNVENYFDTYNNPYRNDDEFTPTGENHWTKEKFQEKRDNIAKTIALAADEYGQFPAIIGLCEVENASVLNQLVSHTPLARVGYKFIHKESPDSRGIDVALLYREDIFTPLEKHFYGVGFSTRDILYTKGVVNSLDTIHILVNHWPSKSGGEKASEPRRKKVAERVKGITDSLLSANPRVNIILMGDFNDTHNSKSMKILTEDNLPDDSSGRKTLVNLAPFALGADGSHKYRGEWSIIDQFLVSTGLLEQQEGIMPQWVFCRKEMGIFAPEFLLEWDNTYMGIKPRRTYQGPKYLGGVSDHLPIILRLYGNKEGQLQCNFD